MSALLITFDRIGRTHDVPPLTVHATDPNKIAEAIYEYARPHLLSRDVDVWVDLAEQRGGITCGFRTGGSFTIADQAATEVAK